MEVQQSAKQPEVGAPNCERMRGRCVVHESRAESYGDECSGAAGRRKGKMGEKK